jgi:hypothetical protein
MNKINVETLNEFFNVDGPAWIECDPSSYISLGNNYPFNSETQREIARQNAIERNKQYKGGNNPRAKTWRITYADGRQIVIKALQRWAIDNGYSRAGIKNIAYGKWKRYRDLIAVEEIISDTNQ